MAQTILLTVTSPDRPGLIDRLSTVLLAHGANWQESRLVTLSGQFAGLLLASLPDAELDALQSDLEGLSTEGLAVSVVLCGAAPEGPAPRAVTLQMTGQDRPGIIHEISHALAACGVSIDELDSRCGSASWSGEVIFHVTAALSVPAELPTARLREVLEALGNELMVDIALDE